ncbi:MAG: MXAN_6640 family putative metalloprotease [Candidatus Limnocylindria bacterium]
MRALGGTVLVLAAFAVWTGAAAAEQRPLPALAPAADDALGDALAEGDLTEAQYALERARSLFRLGVVRREFGNVERADGRDATLLLRDLAVRLRELSGAERRQGERLLARPGDGDVQVGNGWHPAAVRAGPECGVDDKVCVHWVTTSADAPTDPSYPARVQDTFEHVWDHEVEALGYREPLPDYGKGGDDRLDVYLDDLGGPKIGIFGYCAPDTDVLLNFPRRFTVPVYCVVDNDFSATQYGAPPGDPPDPDGFLKVTAAHEFFHAVQGAYDFFEDGWLMEGTATNVEETVYEEIDDNVLFLRRFSPLTRPASPLDRWGFGDAEYGSWIFWRFLEEKVYGNDPSVIRRIWQRAAWAFGPDEYSLQAVARVLRNDGRALPDEFARFGFVNRLRAYADGSLYPATPTHRSFRMGSAKRSTGWQARRLNHLTTQYISFRPRRSGVSRRALLRVNVQVSRHGGRASLIVYRTNGTGVVRRIRLDARGFGARRVFFGRRSVRRVDLVLSNGSSRMRDCFSDDSPPFYSCAGIPKDDRRIYRFRSILRR